ncbi:MAG: hypothetical protein QXL17_00670 [Candidatus Thermoplasmatota archaeon]
MVKIEYIPEKYINFITEVKENFPFILESILNHTMVKISASQEKKLREFLNEHETDMFQYSGEYYQIRIFTT